MADTCRVLGEKLEQKRKPDVSKHLPSTDYRLQHGLQFQYENPPRSVGERECHGVEQYIRFFSSIWRIPIILLDNIILGNCCFWILAKQISCRIVWCMVVTFVKLGQHLTVGLTQQSLKLSCTNNIIISCCKNSARVNLAALTSALTTQRMNGLWIYRQHFFVIFQSRS